MVGVDLDDDCPGDLALACDVTDEDAVRDLYARVREQYGHVDVLFNNAGISPNDDASVLDTTYEAWQRVQDVNLKSVFLCCKYGIAHLLDNEHGGSVINTASFVAVMGAATSQISYTASKGGVLAMSRELGVEFARRGVRVNALCPGPVDTPLLARALRQGSRRRPPGAWSTCRSGASRAPRRSPPARCSWPATSRPSSPPRRSSSTGASAAPTSPPNKPSYEALRFSLTAGQRGGASSMPCPSPRACSPVASQRPSPSAGAPSSRMNSSTTHPPRWAPSPPPRPTPISADLDARQIYDASKNAVTYIVADTPRGSGDRLGLRRLQGRPDRHERPRRRRRLAGPGQDRHERQGPGRHGRRRRPLARPRAAEGRREQPPHPLARRLLVGRRGRPHLRDRQPLRPRPHPDDRDRLGPAAQPPGARRRHDLRRHPDRRRAEPRQLGRPAAQRRRQGDRRQLADPDRQQRAAPRPATSASASRSPPAPSSRSSPRPSRASSRRRRSSKQQQTSPWDQSQGQARARASRTQESQGQQDPYGQSQDQQDPYGQSQSQQDPYGQSQSQQDPYGQSQGQQDPYGFSIG